MTNINDQWDNYMELGKQVVNGSLNKEMFEKQIIALSSFLSETNQDYHYNAAYLPNYVADFWHFLECFCHKYPLVNKLFLMVSVYPNVTLIIDRYWQLESVQGEYTVLTTKKVHPSCERKRVCDNELLIECSVLCDTKRFIYHSKTGTDKDELNQELERLEEFLNDKSLSANH